MNDEQKYLFDLNGYLVLEQVVPPATVDSCNRVLDRLETMDPDDFPEPGDTVSVTGRSEMIVPARSLSLENNIKDPRKTYCKHFFNLGRKIIKKRIYQL